MTKLTAATRNKIPSSEFGLPKTRQYPEENRAHSIDAKARADAQYEKGKLSAAKYEQIVKRANAKLKKGRK